MRPLMVALVTAMLLVGDISVAEAGGGVPVGGGGCVGFSEGSSVALRDYCLDGAAHFGDADEPLAVVNEGRVAHDYTAVDGSFATGRLDPGESVELSDVEPGVHRVVCTLHSSPDGGGMAGVLIVGDVNGVADGASEAAPATAFLAGGAGWVSTVLAAGAGVVAVVALAVGVRTRRRLDVAVAAEGS